MSNPEQPATPVVRLDQHHSMETVESFLTSRGPGAHEWIRDGMKTKRTAPDRVLYAVDWPVLRVHCPHADCDRVQPFDPHQMDTQWLDPGEGYNHFARYACRSCQVTFKTYALRIALDKKAKQLRMFKYGEDFAFGEPTPRKVLDLLGEERPMFLKGREAENREMGIGAFAYYRRVVENKKGKLFAAIIEAAEKMGAEPEVLAELRQAATEKQFTKAVDAVRHGIPSGLKINGHDPLTLLHDALSEGLHAQDDSACLASARSIRVVLIALVERVAEVTREDKVLNEAVADLLKRQRERRQAEQAENNSAPLG